MTCLMRHRRKYEAKIVMKVLVVKLKSITSKMSGMQSFRGTFMTPVTKLCIVMFPNRQVQILLAKLKLLMERKI